MIDTVADYTTVTELPGHLVSREAIDMVRTRYTFAAGLCEGRRVLEVACGPGPGLGVLATRCRSVVGGDYTHQHVALARAQYAGRIPLLRLDAHALPFRPRTFDAVILFEAIYFLASADRAIESCASVLTGDGVVILASVNPSWEGFNAAPFSTRYFSARELDGLLRAHGFTAQIYGGFADEQDGWRDRVLGAARRLAVRLHLIPKTMKGKQLMKRIAFGKLAPFPADVSAATAAYREPVRVDDLDGAGRFKVLYAVGRRIAPGDHLS